MQTANYVQFTKSLDMCTLPRTFRDAITTTRKLSIPYIWIDALCIIQDSEEDKMRDIAQMKDIYSSSVVTIVAASSDSVSGGFLHDRNHSETVYTIPARIRPGQFGTMSVNELDAATYDERSEPLAKRAWTMQEQLLAQRTLTFATHTMIWSCKAGTRNFGDSLYFPHDLDAGYNDNDEKYSLNLNSLLITKQEADSHKDKALSCWLRLVTAYSLRRASLECDKLNAVAGIASSPPFVSSLGPGYFAGLWEYNLARQLTWYTSRWHRTLSEGEVFTPHRPTTYRAPSWSWASLEDGVILSDFTFDDEEETEEVVCEIIECATSKKYPDKNPFGEVIVAHLRLRGSLRNAWFNPLNSMVILLPIPDSDDLNGVQEAVIPYEDAWKKHIADFMEANPDTEPEEAWDEEDWDLHRLHPNVTAGISDESQATNPVIVHCLPVTHNSTLENGVTGLLLTSSGEPGRSLYKRIGLFHKGKIGEFQDLPKKDITLL
ncbi:hypothetical protein SLS62_011158 [Diatrype stigma]|uniref:Heterokaryon incompatibility domain-containing protein n=1 Tax=Diatrype stigma TaxID=117547 RepID=A0AAN9U798_9PEZI